MNHLKQKLLTKVAAVAMLVFMLPLPVFASAEIQENTAVQQEQQILAPISVERKNVDGKAYLIRVYELPAEADIKAAEQEKVVQDSYTFSHLTTEKEINENTTSKNVTEEVKVETQSKNLEDVIKQLPSTKDYSVDGYTGKIVLDTGSIATEVAGYTTRNYTVSTVKEYSGLMYADPSFVSQTAVKDGYTLPLTDINWVVMGTGLAGDSLVPTEYKATATYAKTFSSQVPTGYISTARYTGTVIKTEPGTVCYTVTYIGTPMEKEGISFLWIITFIAALVLLACAVTLTILYLRLKKGADIDNLIDKEYIKLGHQSVDFLFSYGRYRMVMKRLWIGTKDILIFIGKNY